MRDTVPEILHETLEYLQQLWQDNVPPEEALTCFHRLQGRYREIAMDLLWEHEAYAHVVHYDVLLRLPGEGTVSLSFCPDRGVPWLLRHMHSAREGDLVRVNAKTLTVAEAIACLDVLWNEARLMTSLVHVCLIQEAVERYAITLSDAELQQALDAFRMRHGLYSAVETYHWLKQHGMSHARLEHALASQALTAKLRDRITEEEVDAYFIQHSCDFDTIYIARVQVPEAASAQRLYEQICSGTVDFFAAAQHQFLASKGQTQHSLFTTIRRNQLTPPQATALFCAAPGAVVGPLHSGEGYEIVRVLHIEPACLDVPTCEAVKEKLFAEWLAVQRQEATIEWFWGTTDHIAHHTHADLEQCVSVRGGS